MTQRPQTFTELLRQWTNAAELAAGLKRHGCDASETLVRRWWNDEMLPDRAWRAFVALAQETGRDFITLELLAEIAEASRTDRRPIAAAWLRSHSSSGEAAA